jgi:hypothetical protein
MLATKNYNSSKSNTYAILKLKDRGVNDAEIQRTLDALQQGKISYEGIGFVRFVNKIKVGVLDLAWKIVRKVVRFKAGSELASKIK